MNITSDSQPWRMNTESAIKRANEKMRFFDPQRI